MKVIAVIVLLFVGQVFAEMGSAGYAQWGDQLKAYLGEEANCSTDKSKMSKAFYKAMAALLAKTECDEVASFFVGSEAGKAGCAISVQSTVESSGVIHVKMKDGSSKNVEYRSPEHGADIASAWFGGGDGLNARMKKAGACREPKAAASASGGGTQ